MAKEVTKPPKSKQKINPKTTENGENNFVPSKQGKGKVSLSKKSTKEKAQNKSNPLKISSLESNKSKFGDNNKKMEKIHGKKMGFDKKTTMKPLKVSSLEISKRKNGDKGKKIEENTENPSKVSTFLETEKKKSWDKMKKVGEYKVTKWGIERKKIEDKKKKFESDLGGEVEAKPKKKKRVIKIDPYDISNKRINDGNVLNDITNKQKKEVEVEEVEKVELSKNAQFRAIKPSPSILAFVEDNLLGRRRDIELRKAGYNTELSAPLDNIPFSESSERERIEESIFRNKLEFYAAAKVSTSFPPPDLPEIAFAGRSNVGKSSLLNALTRQWGVVRTSDKPGHTQSINFFKLGTKLSLVDLPGYGFAYAKEEVKEAWEELVKEYVSSRIGLKRVCLLVDTKWGFETKGS